MQLFSSNATTYYNDGILYRINGDTKKANELFELAAKQGHAYAAYQLGKSCENSELAFKWFKQAAEVKIPGALYRLGLHYLKIKENREEALNYFKEAMNLGHEKSLIMYKNLSKDFWEDLVKDFISLGSEKKQCLKEKADSGDKEAQYTYAKSCETKDSSENVIFRVMSEKIKYLTLAAKQGHILSQYELGLFYLKQKKLHEAFIYFQFAADGGHSESQCKIGDFYYLHNIPEKDDAKALIWYKKAQEQGLVLANNRLGTMYRDGRGVDKDMAQARKEFLKANHGGDDSVSYEMALWYKEQNNYAKFIEHLRTACACTSCCFEDWYKKACLELGKCYWFGLGVDKNRGEACHLFKSSSDIPEASYYVYLSHAAPDVGLRYLISAAEEGFPEAIKKLEEEKQKNSRAVEKAIQERDFNR